MPRAPSKAELQERLTRAERQNGAYFEWLRSLEKEAADVLDVKIEERVALRVVVRGLFRACGGVAVVEQLDSDWRDAPVYLSDLISRWLHDSSPYIREAARTLLRLQEDAAKVAS